jgi:hypothetical protein
MTTTGVHYDPERLANLLAIAYRTHPDRALLYAMLDAGAAPWALATDDGTIELRVGFRQVVPDDAPAEWVPLGTYPLGAVTPKPQG